MSVFFQQIRSQKHALALLVGNVFDLSLGVAGLAVMCALADHWALVVVVGATCLSFTAANVVAFRANLAKYNEWYGSEAHSHPVDPLSPTEPVAVPYAESAVPGCVWVHFGHPECRVALLRYGDEPVGTRHVTGLSAAGNSWVEDGHWMRCDLGTAINEVEKRLTCERCGQ